MMDEGKKQSYIKNKMIFKEKKVGVDMLILLKTITAIYLL